MKLKIVVAYILLFLSFRGMAQDFGCFNGPNTIIGGYVKENGISLCPDCHQKAEVFHSTGTPVEGYSPDDLYKKINSSYEKAVEASNKLGS